jgi:tetratricopeptide (TPR) repeat protein
VFDEIDEIILQIQFDHTKRTNARIEESFANAFHGKSSAGIDGNVIHSQIMLNILIQIISSATDKNELVSLCQKQYGGNQQELAILHEFEQNYSADKALWWYSRESFLYRILNKALRTGNIDSLYFFRFFIRDLRMQLERNQCVSRVRVYRGQSMSKEEIEFLRNSVGQLILMNSFLSTSLDQQVVAEIFSKPSANLESVIFQIDADPRHCASRPFADITPFSAFSNEGEVLFMLGSIFRIVSIDRREHMHIVQMTLCNDDDDNRSITYQFMNTQYTDADTNLIALANILRDAGRLDEAEKYYNRLLEQLSQDHPDIAACYHGLGDIANDKGDYDKSLEYHKISFEIMARTLKTDDYFLAYSYNSTGNVYAKKGDYYQALEAYKMALIIWKRTFGEDHLDVALCLNNMGAVHERMIEYSNAYKCHQKALVIRTKHLPTYHPHLAQSHNNIGLVHSCRGDFDLAIKHYNYALVIKSKILPPKHPDVAMTLYNLGIVYEYKRKLQQAREYYEQAAIIYHHAFSPTHSNVLRIQESIRRVSQ